MPSNLGMCPGMCTDSSMSLLMLEQSERSEPSVLAWNSRHASWAGSALTLVHMFGTLEMYAGCRLLHSKEKQPVPPWGGESERSEPNTHAWKSGHVHWAQSTWEGEHLPYIQSAAWEGGAGNPHSQAAL